MRALSHLGASTSAASSDTPRRHAAGVEWRAQTAGCLAGIASADRRPCGPQRRRWHSQHTGVPRAAAGDDVQQLQLDLPSAEFSRVRKSVYVSSSVDLKGCPPERHPEFAVIGRSNVGKSSIINLLTSNDKLAKVSKEPGR